MTQALAETLLLGSVVVNATLLAFIPACSATS